MSKPTTQDKLVAFALKQNWVLDASITINTYNGWSFSKLTPEQQANYIKQHPFIFTRPAKSGGRWQIELDYRNKGTYGGRFGNRLHGAILRHFADDGTPTKRLWKLVKPGRYGINSDNTYEVTGDYDTPIVKRVERLLTDPEAVVWLASELRWNNEQSTIARMEAIRIDRELRDRPLPEGWAELAKVARTVANADGKTDTDALLHELTFAIEAVRRRFADASYSAGLRAEVK